MSKYWGFECSGGRYLIVMWGTSEGYAVSTTTWADKETMCLFWSDKAIQNKDYSFHKFESRKALYQWLLDGELY